MEERDDDSDDDRDGDAQIGRYTPVSAAGDGTPDLDEFLELLGDRRRRYALYYLRENGVRERDALARLVAAELAGTDPERVSESGVAEVETMLVHVDIPKLVESGVVSYDSRTETLRLDYPPSTIETLLDACAALDEIDSSGNSRTNDREPE